MSAKEVTCILCGNIVSKRKSLVFGEGRACREHEEVIQMVVDKEAQEEMERSAKKVDEIMRVIMLTQNVRIFHTLHHVPLSILFNKIRYIFDEDTEKKVREDVEEQGAVISSEDMLEGIAMYAELKRRAEKSL